MTDRRYAATPWEVEAERRREVIEADARHPSTTTEPGRESFVVARGRRLLRSIQGGSLDEAPGQAGRLNQKRV
jgi:hypothetical protein